MYLLSCVIYYETFLAYEESSKSEKENGVGHFEIGFALKYFGTGPLLCDMSGQYEHIPHILKRLTMVLANIVWNGYCEVAGWSSSSPASVVVKQWQRHLRLQRRKSGRTSY